MINRTPSTIHKGRTPYEILHGSKPSYEQLRVFGSSWYTHRVTRDKDKFGERSRPCIFVGYPFGKKGWKVYDIERNEFLVSRDVIFQETVFPFEKSNSNSSLSVESPLLVPCDEDWQVVSSLPDKESNDTAPISPVRGSDETGSSSPSKVVTPSPVQDNEVSSSPEQNLLEDSPSIDNVVTHVDLVDPVSKPSTSESESLKVVPVIKPRQSQRPYNAPVWLKVYVTNNVICTPDPLHALSDPTSQSSNSVPCKSQYPFSDYISDEYFSSGHRAFLAAVTSNIEPKHFKEAVKIDVWNKAMATEVDTLEINKTWDLCDLPPNKTALGSQWVYKTKFNSDGSVERYKARLVALGNNQVEGEDYTETFAPVVKMTTVRTLLRLVAANQWEMYQMDVHNAFLHGDLDEEVYMKLPPGFRHSHPDKVCRLRKSLYGLKQAPRCWFKKLSDSLLKFGFVQSYDDYSLFSYTHKDIELRVLIYVDDLLICGNDGYMLKKFK